MIYAFLLALLILACFTFAEVRATRQLACKILRLLLSEHEAARLVLTVTYPDGTKLEDVKMFSMTDSQQVVASVQPVTAKGKPAQVQSGSVEWSSSNPGVITVTEDPSNELSALIVAGAPGIAQVTFSADADLGEGVVPISGVADVEVTASAATGFDVKFGAPTEQP